MTDALTRLLEAVERGAEDSLLSLASEVRKARGEAVAWGCPKCGGMEDWVEQNGVRICDHCQPASEYAPLFSASPDTVPRADVERLAKLITDMVRRYDIDLNEEWPEADAALKACGMEAKRG